MSYASELARIAERDGKLTPAVVVAEATPKSSPLHDFFEWNNAAAGARYRLVQAAMLIRRCKVTIETSPEMTARVRAYTNVPEAGGYLPTADALAEHRDVVLTQAMRDIAALRKKYAHLIDFDAVLRSALSDEVAA